jgi:ferredoxin
VCRRKNKGELLADGRLQILGYTKYKEMIRLSTVTKPVSDEEQEIWIEKIFEEQPYLANVYPGNTRNIGIVFEIRNASIEYFHLGVNPIFRETYTIGNAKILPKGYIITGQCIACGACEKNCPQKCITSGTIFEIQQEHCLHCGNCAAHCPVHAVERLCL